jgi:hypothetical protein
MNENTEESPAFKNAGTPVPPTKSAGIGAAPAGTPTRPSNVRKPAPASAAAPKAAAPAPAPTAGPATLASAPLAKPAAAPARPVSHAPDLAKRASQPTTIEAKIDVGFGNTLYVRGQGGGLSWDTGVPLTCVGSNVWRWTSRTTEQLTFKLLVNDAVWAQGKDIVVAPGQRVEVAPSF